MIACVRLCVVPLLHVPPCTCTVDCRPHPDHCTGCQPAEATRGWLDETCSRRLRDHLGAREAPDGPHGIAWAYRWLAGAHPAVATPQPSSGRGGSDIGDHEAERLVAVVALRDDIRAWLVTTVASLVERTGLTGPAGVRLGTDFRHRLVGRGEPEVRQCAGWLLRQVESLEADEAVGETWDELAGLMSRAHALAPWRPAPTLIEGVPCRCGATALHDHGDEVLCWSCRRSYDHGQYRALTVVLARRFTGTTRETIDA